MFTDHFVTSCFCITLQHQTGFPSVGKSSLLNELTDTESMAAGYEFTTLTCIPGNVYYNDTRIQVRLAIIML
jgi:ribosome-interacting GTPase 1